MNLLHSCLFLVGLGGGVLDQRASVCGPAAASASCHSLMCTLNWNFSHLPVGCLEQNWDENPRLQTSKPLDMQTQEVSGRLESDDVTAQLL